MIKGKDIRKKDNRKWEVGDRVGLYANNDHNPWYSETGIVGTILRSGWHPSVMWDNGLKNGYSRGELFEVIENIMDVDELFSEIDI